MNRRQIAERLIAKLAAIVEISTLTNRVTGAATVIVVGRDSENPIELTEAEADLLARVIAAEASGRLAR